MNYGSTYNWRLPSKEETRLIKKLDNKRFLRRTKNFFLFLALIILLIYLATFASLSYKDNTTENVYTLLILTAIIFFSVIFFLVVYKLLHRHFYGVEKAIEQVNDRVTFLYHHMVGGVNDQDKLYAIVLRVDNEQIELLVDQNDYETINENTKLLLGRYHDGAEYNYYVYY